MTASQIRNAIFAELDQRLAEFGFSRVSDKFNGDRYYRSFEGGRQVIQIVSYDRSGCVEVDYPEIGIRLDRVEELAAKFEEFSPLIRSGDIDARSTVGMSLEPEGFLSIFRKTWTICQDREVRKFAAEFVSSTMAKAEPIWRRLSDPEEILHVLTANAGELSGGTPAMAAIRAIALSMIRQGRTAGGRTAETAVARLRGSARREVENWIARAFKADAWQ